MMSHKVIFPIPLIIFLWKHNMSPLAVRQLSQTKQQTPLPTPWQQFNVYSCCHDNMNHREPKVRAGSTHSVSMSVIY